jgi:hypothetical protein
MEASGVVIIDPEGDGSDGNLVHVADSPEPLEGFTHFVKGSDFCPSPLLFFFIV